MARTGCRNPRANHQLLRETLRGLDARRFARGAEDRQAPGLEQIHDPRFERSLRADHSEIHSLLLGELRHWLQFVGGNRNTPRHVFDPRIPRCRDEFGVGIVAAKLPGERVLAPAAADDQNFHPNACSRSAIRSPTSPPPHDGGGRPSRSPSPARRSGGTEACVIDAGWLIRLSTPPSDSASEKTRTFPRVFAAFSLLPMRMEIIPPNPFICLLASSCCGCDASPG